VTVQAQILVLLRELQRDFGTAIVMITHDLGVVAGLCDEVMVLYGGRVMEQGPAEHIFNAASHPYTLGLLRAIPRMDRDDLDLVAIPGAPPNMAHLPKGCPFSARCTWAEPKCLDTAPTLQALPGQSNTLRACHHDALAVQQGQTKEVAHA
jgi:oligopeptide transport system ATP-binding protein